MFIVDTDASNVWIGGVLSQVQDGSKHVVTYFSTTLSKAEMNCVTRRELLATVKSLEHFYKYLYGQKFLLRTDHSALTWLLSFRNLEYRELDGFSACRSTTSHLNSVKAYNTQTQMSFAGDHDLRSASTAEGLYNGQTAKGANIAAAATANGWDRQALREQLADNDVDPLKMET